MSSLFVAAILFVAVHLWISGTRLRDVIVGAIGEKP